MLRRVLIVPIVMVLLGSSASAGIFSRKPKPNPAERVPELLGWLKSNNDESKRLEAAEELRQYDPKSFAEIVPALIDSLGKDASTTVRSESAASLAKLRPISQQAGYALEQAMANDPSLRVRMAARQALLQYSLVGYRAGKPPEKPNEKAGTDAAAQQPAQNPSQVAVKSAPPSTSKKVTSKSPFQETQEPPLADPVGPKVIATPVSQSPNGKGPVMPPAPIPAPRQDGPVLQPLPGGPSPESIEVPALPLVPVSAPKKTEGDGPALPPPN